MKPRAVDRATRQGFSLLEVLIAMVILAFGILGAVGLQLVSKRNTVDSDQRSIAAYQAYQLVERMRANTSQVTLATYTSQPTLGRGTMGSSPVVNCEADVCTPAQLALYDLWGWEQALDGAQETLADGTNVGGLINPTACISGPGAGAPGIYTVTIAWRGTASLPQGDPAACGMGLGLYGDNDQFRHQMTVSTYMN